MDDRHRAHQGSSEKWHEYKRIYMDDAPAGCRYLLTFFEGLHINELTAHVNEYWHSFMKLEYIDQPVELLYYREDKGFKI